MLIHLGIWVMLECMVYIQQSQMVSIKVAEPEFLMQGDPDFQSQWGSADLSTITSFLFRRTNPWAGPLAAWNKTC